MQNKRRMLLLTVLATLAALLLCSAAPATVPLPAEAAAVLENGYWKDYSIPCVTHGDAVIENQNRPAAAGYDENGHAAAFAMQQKEGRNALCILEKNKKGEWRVSAWSEKAVWQGKQIPLIENETYDKFTVFYFDAEGELELDYTFEKQQGDWYLTDLAIHDEEAPYQHVQVETGKLIYSDRDWKKTTVYGIAPRQFEQFNLSSFPRTVQEARESLTLPPAIPGSSYTGNLPEPDEVSFTSNQKYAVYSGPGEHYLRSANGKASMSTNDWVQVFGTDGEWALVQYDISSDKMRFGYIPAEVLPKVYDAKPLSLLRQPANVAYEASVTDDPLNSRDAIGKLVPGMDNVILLGYLGSDWSYIEATVNNVPLRGFVPCYAVETKPADVLTPAKDTLTEVYGLTATELEADYATDVQDLGNTAVIYTYPRNHPEWKQDYYVLTADKATGQITDSRSPFTNGYEHYPSEGTFRMVLNNARTLGWLDAWSTGGSASFAQAVHNCGTIVYDDASMEAIRQHTMTAGNALEQLFLWCYGEKATWTEQLTAFYTELRLAYP